MINAHRESNSKLGETTFTPGSITDFINYEGCAQIKFKVQKPKHPKLLIFSLSTNDVP